VRGLAEGPYPGTYEETGTATLGPGAVSTGVSRPVTGFEATFTIDSPAGQVSGTKTWDPTTFQPGVGTCGASGPTRNILVFNATATYEASIQTADGVFADRGNTAVDGAGVDATDTDDFGTHVEVFQSVLLAPVPAGPATVTLSPPDAVNNVGTSHTVTATATTASGQPVQGATILFQVSGADSASGTCTTNASGQCSFTYQGPNLPGADLITGCADNNHNTTADPGEPCGTATKAWLLPTSTPGQITGGGQIPNAANNDQAAFGFNAKSDSKGVKGECTVVDPTPSTKIKCLDVTNIVVAGTHATFFGNATVNGQPTNYRIDVDDNGEPGKNRDTFKIQTGSGYTAGGTITGGNVQVH
jgi:hypothetical protein